MAPSPKPTADNNAKTDEGFVFAVSGKNYLPLAIRAAQTIREHHPNHPIDLFSDQPCDAAVFDQVIPLEDAWFRPRFEALRRSRFTKSIVLDADIICVAPIGDVFELMDRFDLAAAHEPRRASDLAVRHFQTPVPAAFPQLNSGVVAIRKSPAVDAFFNKVENAMKESKMNRDQPVVRTLLFESDLRLWVLPPEYNFMNIDLLEAYSEQNGAPRILHLTRLHRHFDTLNTKKQLHTVGAICGPAIERHIAALLASDRTLGGDGARVRPLFRQRLTGLARGLSQSLAKRLCRLSQRG
ncbi:putative nucleotide-diphospho-sugar transferase [Vannielia sp.]|uniref:putative nucleotide-diphospho-sugar transferase n=1 Tax=Vannielia sp. TaxID=2813045 RepID=UPI0026381F46|nr:putative nucleotide-diphospho-sugar transferase [Vannielia sp.]MDF1871812.1 putative nucleotide-diphospho-sugar transferase [Vannielia sp.]